MKRYLLVGDPHATPSELGDCRALIGLIEEKAKGVDEIIFLGDLYHTHALINVEVLVFWTQALARLAKVAPVRVIVGNHDMPGNDSSSAHALWAQQELENVTVVDKPCLVGDVAFMPYVSSAEEFQKQAQEVGGRILFCHQTFNGSVFENGFFAKDGADPLQIPQEKVISGHIHAPQEFSKVWYPGAPRWRTLSDANTDRAIWDVVVAIDDAGVMVSKTPITTRGVCREIVHVVIRDGEVCSGQLRFEDNVLASDVDWHIDIHGNAAENESLKQKLSRPGVKVRCFNTAVAAVAVKESEGIGSAFKKLVFSMKTPFDVDREKLLSVALERLGWT